VVLGQGQEQGLVVLGQGQGQGLVVRGQGQGFVIRGQGQGLVVLGQGHGQGLVNWSSGIRTFLEENNIGDINNLRSLLAICNIV